MTSVRSWSNVQTRRVAASAASGSGPKKTGVGDFERDAADRWTPVAVLEDLEALVARCLPVTQQGPAGFAADDDRVAVAIVPGCA
jgi:hypothetical protein